MNKPLNTPHCRSCGSDDNETVVLANQNEGCTECCNKSLAYGCDDRCYHNEED